MDKKKWFTEIVYVDIETGEIITKSLAEREYYETGKKSQETITNEKYNIKRYTKECRKHGRLRLFES